MRRNSTGYYDSSVAGGETVRAFVPNPLPPEPSLDLSGDRQRLIEKATLALGRLDSVYTLRVEIHGLEVVHVSPKERLRQRAASRREVLRQANRATGLKIFDRDRQNGATALIGADVRINRCKTIGLE